MDKQKSGNKQFPQAFRYISFDKILLETINDSLNCLGGDSENTMFFHEYLVVKIKKRSKSQKINQFCNSFEDLFGLGYKQLEILFSRCFLFNNKKCGIDIQILDYKQSFLEYVSLIRKQNDAERNN